MEAIPAERFRLGDTPPKPDWFDEALAKAVPRYGGKPMFRVVDGMRETAWMQGDPTFLKYTNKEIQCVPVRHVEYVRTHVRTRKKVSFVSREAAEAYTGKGYGEAVEKVYFERRWIGRPCWVVEVYLEPKAMPSKEEWELSRYEYIDVNGVIQKVDLLGEYPPFGKYVWMMDVLDEDGVPTEPNQKTIDECQRRYWEVLKDNRSIIQRTKDDYERVEKLDKKVARDLTEAFFGHYGISAKRAFGTEISKPIKSVKQ